MKCVLILTLLARYVSGQVMASPSTSPCLDPKKNTADICIDHTNYLGPALEVKMLMDKLANTQTEALNNLNVIWYSACVQAATTTEGKDYCDHFFRTMHRVINMPEPSK